MRETFVNRILKINPPADKKPGGPAVLTKRNKWRNNGIEQPGGHRRKTKKDRQMKQPKPSDKVFANDAKIGDFKFDEKVARVFDDMLDRSVPFYKEAQMMALRLALNFVKDKSNIYDLGCSTGNILKGLLNLMPGKSVKLIGVDNSPAMLKQAKKKISTSKNRNSCELRLADINQGVEIDNASVVIMNYTLQFVRPLFRETLMRQIYAGLHKNGCLILIEKVLGNDSLLNRMYIDLYYEYKKGRGYSSQEIARKREALENVLIPYRIDENTRLLTQCGFEPVDIFFKWYNFAGFIAVKP